MPMQQAVKTETGPRRLTITEVLDWLVEDKIVAPDAAEEVKKERRYYRGNLHPLAVVAEQKWKKGAAALTLPRAMARAASAVPRRARRLRD